MLQTLATEEEGPPDGVSTAVSRFIGPFRGGRVLAATGVAGQVLGVANSADRTPPAQAYALFESAVRELNAAASGQ